MMDAELKRKWIEALRSGEYKQGTGKLHDPTKDTFCCLGVLCRVVGASFGDNDIPFLDGRAISNEGDEELSREFLREVGIIDQGALIDLNDGRNRNDPSSPFHRREHSFSEIADYIEKTF